MLVRRQGVIWVTRHPQHLLGVVINTDANTAFGGTAVANRESNTLVRIQGDLAGFRVYRVFRCQGVAVDAVPGGTAGSSVDQALADFFQRPGVTRGKGCNTAGRGSPFKKTTTILLHVRA